MYRHQAHKDCQRHGQQNYRRRAQVASIEPTCTFDLKNETLEFFDTNMSFGRHISLLEILRLLGLVFSRINY